MSSTLKLSARDHPIRAVTIYKSQKAEVVRSFSLDLQSGNTKIEITELPSCIDTHSVRVSGLGDTRLFDVVCTARDKPNKSSDAVRLLKTQKLALQGQKRVRDYESDLLVNYAKTLKGEHVSPTQMGEFLQSFVEQGRKNLEAVADLDEKIVVLNRQIELEQEKEAARKGAAAGEVTIVVGADAPSHVDLKLTYIVTNASWESTYELHAATENGKPSPTVTLHYRARITQSTGEDWSDTALTLSTVAASTIAKAIPFLNPIRIRPQVRGGGFSNFSKNNTNTNEYKPIFGQTSMPQMPAGFGAFGGSTSTPQAFGANTQSVPAQANVFGLPRTNATGLFGSSAPQTSGGLFGASQAQTGSLFGSSTSAQPQGASAFGQTQSIGPSLFGSSQMQQQPTTFGGTSSAVPQQTLFGAATQPAAQEQQPAPEVVSASGTGTADDNDEFEEIAIPGAQAGPTTIVTETPLAISYAVEGATTVPSDGAAHQVTVAVLPFEATISHICTPRLDPRVYLQCNVKNTSEYRLLPGLVSVVVNDSFVSKTTISEIGMGETFECTLGDDVSTKVTYERSSKTRTEPSGSFAETMNSTTYRTKIKIHNKHPFALADLVVRDIIPTSDDKRAKVLLHKPAGLADAKDGEDVQFVGKKGLKARWGKTPDGRPGEKDGRYEWVWSVDAGKAVELEAEWELKAPADTAWVEFVPFSSLFGNRA